MVVPYIVMLIFGGVFFVVPFLNFGQRKKHAYGHKKNCWWIGMSEQQVDRIHEVWMVKFSN